jgi:hypothetical protein
VQLTFVSIKAKSWPLVYLVIFLIEAWEYFLIN